MLRKAVLRRGLAAAAVVAVGAVGAGCTVRPVTGPPAADAKPGGGLAGEAATPRTEPARPVADATKAAPPTRTPTPPPAPALTRTPPPSPSPEATRPEATRPPTLMASGARSDQVRELQSRLRQIGYFTRTPTGYYGSVTADAVSSFQGRRGLPRTGATDTVTWQKLLGMTRKPTRDELRPPTTEPVAAPDPRCLKGRVMCISKNSRTLSWMIDGTVKSSMDVRFGSEYTPTREGTFEVFWKSRHHVSTLYDSPMPYAMFFSGGQAVHYSADFAARGYAGASHGCVNVRDEGKIASLFEQVRTGDKVVIYW
ncbi:peptidoglycan-binding protein [Streptomyces sp. NPDC051569]|uniref:L,D-transpeptidase family protein n=1 Tax=Streptomyces sp. NPDC051569 TaxID=3365661 RepID=UPI0037AB2639